MLTTEQKLDLSNKAKEMELEDLNKWFDKTNSKLNNKTFKVSTEDKQAISSLLNSKDMFSLDFQMAKAYLELRNKTNESNEITINDLRVLQQIVVSSRFSNPVQAELIHNVFTAMTPFNGEVWDLETELKIVSEFLVKKEQEQMTGLKYSEEDHQNNLKLNGLVQDEQSDAVAIDKKVSE